jgi:hypothetical protein
VCFRVRIVDPILERSMMTPKTFTAKNPNTEQRTLNPPGPISKGNE